MNEGTCKYQGCVKQARSRNWCSAHYERWRKHGDPAVVLPPSPPPRNPRVQGGPCLVADCPRLSLAKDLCDLHYRRQAKYGDPMGRAPARPPRKPAIRKGRVTWVRANPEPCAIDECSELERSLGLCSSHYYVHWKYGDPLWQAPAYDVCTVDDCDSPSRNAANPLCEAHYCRKWRNGTLEVGQCTVCQGPLPADSPFSRRFCADCALARRRARSRDAEHRRRAASTGEHSERVDTSQIYERDGWRCGICRKRVDRRLAWPHPKSPSLDHVVPISEGGAHTKANVRLAHLTCNTARGARGGGEQLALIG